MPWSAWSGGWLRWTQGKTGHPVEVPVHQALADALAALPNAGATIIVRDADMRPAGRARRGKAIVYRPYTESGFRASFFGLVRRLRDAGKVGAGLSFHGLRRTAATRLAEAGADARVIAAILGHRSARMTEEYSAGADVKRRAAAVVAKMGRPRPKREQKLQKRCEKTVKRPMPNRRNA